MAGKLDDILKKTTPPEPETTEENLGPCAAIAKDKWVSALTIRHIGKAWESFQYRGIATRSVYEPEEFWFQFLDDEEKWKLTVTGRNLFRIYNLIVQGRLEWIRPAERDFAGDKEAIITHITVEQIADKT